MTFAPPIYMYWLKMFLFQLSEDESNLCGIGKLEIESWVNTIFESHFDNIKLNSRLYFAGEFSRIYAALLKGDGGYNFEKLMANDEYLDVILQSVSFCDDFFAILDEINETYFVSNDVSVFDHKNIREHITEKVRQEIVRETSGIIKQEIRDYMNENQDEFEDLEYYDDMADAVSSSGVYDTALDLVTDAVDRKLEEYSYLAIDTENLDPDIILSEELNMEDMVKEIYDEELHPESKETIQTINESAIKIKKLFEDTSWIDK